MIKITYLNPRILIADEEKVLTNGSTYSPVVYLGKDENVDNWQEIDEADAPKVEEKSEVEI